MEKHNSECCEEIWQLLEAQILTDPKMNDNNSVATNDHFSTEDNMFLEAKIKRDERPDIRRHEYIFFGQCQLIRYSIIAHQEFFLEFYCLS